MTKKTFIIIIVLFSAPCMQAQKTIQDLPVEKELNREDVRDFYLGWEQGLHKPVTETVGKTLGGRAYTARQLNNAQNFIQWMQASYTPKGSVGSVKPFVGRAEDKYRNFGLNTFYYDKDIPLNYGAYVRIWNPVKKRANNTFYAFKSEPYWSDWHITVNKLEGITSAVNAISSPGEPFFIVPAYMPGEPNAGLWPTAQKNYSFLNFGTHPNLQPYRHYVIPVDHESIAGRGLYVVLLTKNNQPLPFETITLGEFLDRLEKNLPILFKAYYEGRTPPVGALQQAQKNMTLIQQNYRNRRGETANIQYTQLNFMNIYNADGGKLHFLEANSQIARFNVMRLKKGVAEACKGHSPQWIAITWDADETLGTVHKMESILNNFNFKYVYDYFFGDDKVITPYQPLRPPLSESPSVKTPVAQSKAAENASKDRNILFFDDFSAVAVNAVATQWNSSTDGGYKVRVKELEGSKWLELGKQKAQPKTDALPADFSLSFNVAVPKDFPYSAKPLNIKLYDQPVDITVRDLNGGFDISIQPGANGNPGFLSAGGIVGDRSSGYSGVSCEKQAGRTYPYIKIPDFSNNKTLNTVAIQIIKKGESLQVLANGQKLYDCPKAIPAGTPLKTPYFYHFNDVKYYINNVKLEKL